MEFRKKIIKKTWILRRRIFVFVSKFFVMCRRALTAVACGYLFAKFLWLLLLLPLPAPPLAPFFQSRKIVTYAVSCSLRNSNTCSIHTRISPELFRAHINIYGKPLISCLLAWTCVLIGKDFTTMVLLMHSWQFRSWREGFWSSSASLIYFIILLNMAPSLRPRPQAKDPRRWYACFYRVVHNQWLNSSHLIMQLNITKPM